MAASTENQKVRKCKTCQNVPEKWQRHCESCKEKKKTQYKTGKCAVCGEPCMGDAFRCWKCRINHGLKLESSISWCRVCGRSFQRRHNSENKCCSRDCGFEFLRISRKELRASKNSKSTEPQLLFRQCWCCSLWFITKQKRKQLCSKACRSQIAKNSAKHHYYQNVRDNSDRYCIDCTAFIPGQSNLKHIRCRRCQRKRERELNGSCYARARKFGVQRERFRRRDVFIRDRFKCVRCGNFVMRTNEYYKYQATIDHAIPLSRGGSHTIENCQTMCHECNVAKGTKTNLEWVFEGWLEDVQEKACINTSLKERTDQGATTAAASQA